jgi:Fur family zinc uptake transcriptional regulator
LVCHQHEENHVGCEGEHVSHSAQFAVCRACGTVEEIHDSRIEDYIKKIGKTLNFSVESETLELSGTCAKCS